MNTSCITFLNVTKTFDMRLLYKNISFELQPSHIVLVTGNNGTGKTTLLRMAAGLCSPTEGEVICHLPQEKCAYLGHTTFIYPQLSALENLEFWTCAMQQKKPTQEEIFEVLKQVNLDHFAHDPAGIFSRGMSQRLNIARILLQNPKFLMLDEPCTGLDNQSKEIFYRCVTDFAQKKACVLWVSHDSKTDSAYASHHIHIEKQQATLTKIGENAIAYTSF